MCQFFSGIITRDKTIWDYDNDSHDFLIKKVGLQDKTNSPDFVRVELLPVDGDVFNHTLDNWKIHIDQDFKPEWFSADFAEKEMKEAARNVFAGRFIINDKTNQSRSNQRVFLENSSAKLYGNSSAKLYCNSSAELYCNSSAKLYDSSSAELFGSSSAKLYGSSSAELCENSQIIIPKDYSKNVKITAIHDSASVKDLRVNKIFVADEKLKLEIFKNTK